MLANLTADHDPSWYVFLPFFVTGCSFVINDQLLCWMKLDYVDDWMERSRLPHSDITVRGQPQTTCGRPLI
ncbi:hypothetical protein K449DRAFT_60717 [Hypoxylon sp. EC38]|nr:hypothetical protein K449DRAFT_60717 [Hypoxylon sp. EC38]